MVVWANPHRFDLSHLTGRGVWAAGPGKPGGPRRERGQDGPPLRIDVPLGTTVVDLRGPVVLADLVEAEASCVVARGGAGGLGSAHLASPTHRTPREGQPGQPGEERKILLRLSLMVDIALVGPPNAGRSTLLAAITRAQPRIEPWPFTTTAPVLGALLTETFQPLVVAELPGLVEGSSEGKGLGNDFLVHAERAALLAIVVQGGATAAKDIQVTREELAKYGHGLAEKPWVVCPTREPLPEGIDAPCIMASQGAGAAQEFTRALIQAWRRARAGSPHP